jgi:hypothetical protein
VKYISITGPVLDKNKIWKLYFTGTRRGLQFVVIKTTTVTGNGFIKINMWFVKFPLHHINLRQLSAKSDGERLSTE